MEAEEDDGGGQYSAIQLIRGLASYQNSKLYTSSALESKGGENFYVMGSGNYFGLVRLRECRVNYHTNHESAKHHMMDCLIYASLNKNSCGGLLRVFSLRHGAQELNANYLNLFEAIPKMKVSFEPKTLLVPSREKDYDSLRRKEDLKCPRKEKYTPIVTKADEERMNYYVLKSCLSMHANITMDPVCLGRVGSVKPTGCWYVYLVRFDDELGIEKILERGKWILVAVIVTRLLYAGLYFLERALCIRCWYFHWILIICKI